MKYDKYIYSPVSIMLAHVWNRRSISNISKRPSTGSSIETRPHFGR